MCAKTIAVLWKKALSYGSPVFSVVFRIIDT